MLSDAILTLRSLEMVEVFLGVAGVWAEVGAGEVADFLVFAVG